MSFMDVARSHLDGKLQHPCRVFAIMPLSGVCCPTFTWSQPLLVVVRCLLSGVCHPTFTWSQPLLVVVRCLLSCRCQVFAVPPSPGPSHCWLLSGVCCHALSGVLPSHLHLVPATAGCCQVFAVMPLSCVCRPTFTWSQPLLVVVRCLLSGVCRPTFTWSQPLLVVVLHCSPFSCISSVSHVDYFCLL